MVNPIGEISLTLARQRLERDNFNGGVQVPQFQSGGLAWRFLGHGEAENQNRRVGHFKIVQLVEARKQREVTGKSQAKVDQSKTRLRHTST